MKMPLFISTYCGNHYEALKDGINGYSFDPYNPDEIKENMKTTIRKKFV